MQQKKIKKMIKSKPTHEAILKKLDKQQKNEWKRRPTKQKITLNLKFRDEICMVCKKKFRAGFAAEGYAEVLFIGYHHAGMKRRNMICANCVHVLLKLVGEPSMDILLKAPQMTYKADDLQKFPKRATGMSWDGNHYKYNRKKLEIAVKKFSKKMKKLEPYSNIDYYKLSGLKR